MTTQTIEIPVLPLRDVVVFPSMVIPLFVGREKSVQALEHAMRHDKQILLVAQKEAGVDSPAARDLAAQLQARTRLARRKHAFTFH